MTPRLNSFSNPFVSGSATGLFQAKTFHHYNHPNTNIVGIKPVTAAFRTERPGKPMGASFSLDANTFPNSGLEEDNGHGIWTIFMEQSGQVIPHLQFPIRDVNIEAAIGKARYPIPAQYEGHSYLFDAALRETDEVSIPTQFDFHVANMVRYAEYHLPNELKPDNWAEFFFRLKVPEDRASLFKELKEQNEQLEFHVSTSGMVAALVKASGLKLSTAERRRNIMYSQIDDRGMQRVF